MNVNKWTMALAAAGIVTTPVASQAEELVAINTALSSTVISGYVNTSVHWNPGTGNANNPGYSYGGTLGTSPKADGFNLDVVKLSIERPLDESAWAAGYRADLIFGPDAAEYATTSSGLGGLSDFAIKQAYVALRAPVGNGLDFKVGVFDTIIGYESFDAGNNPNYTRSYGYTIEPTAHTGVLMSYQFTDWFSASAGIANTHSPAINERAFLTGANTKAESYKTYMGSVALTAPEDFGFLSGSALYAGVVNGFNTSGGNTGDGAVQTSWYIGATLNTPWEALKVGASYDYAGISEQDLDVDQDSSYRNATAIYASLRATEQFSIHGRFEYFSQSDSLAGPTLPGKVLAYTATLQYDLWKNVISRLEFRWDHSASGDEAFGGETAGVPTKKNAYLVAANFIYKF